MKPTASDKTSAQPKRPPAKSPTAPARPGRDLGREDADSPHAIPQFPPRGDGS